MTESPSLVTGNFFESLGRRPPSATFGLLLGHSTCLGVLESLGCVTGRKTTMLMGINIMSNSQRFFEVYVFVLKSNALTKRNSHICVFVSGIRA